LQSGGLSVVKPICEASCASPSYCSNRVIGRANDTVYIGTGRAGAHDSRNVCIAHEGAIDMVSVSRGDRVQKGHVLSDSHLILADTVRIPDGTIMLWPRYLVKTIAVHWI